MNGGCYFVERVKDLSVSLTNKGCGLKKLWNVLKCCTGMVVLNITVHIVDLELLLSRMGFDICTVL